jgi:hypothetical protein
MDLEHWAAFRESFDRLCKMVADIAAGRDGDAPATVVALSGDVHHAYLMEVEFPERVQSRVYQAVCSPFRNPLDSNERRAIRFAASRAGAAIGRALRRSARLPDAPIRWRMAHDKPWFDNMVATLRLDGDDATLFFERVGASRDGDDLELETVYERDL